MRVDNLGGMAERTKALVSKTSMRATASWVRIPLPPPDVSLFPFLSNNSLTADDKKLVAVVFMKALPHLDLSGCHINDTQRFLVICVFFV